MEITHSEQLLQQMSSSKMSSDRVETFLNSSIGLCLD